MQFTLIPGNAVGTSHHGFDTPGGPFSFTTPQPPPGRYLFSVVLCNDLHRATCCPPVTSPPQPCRRI
jgi:hypothetical protein